MALIDEGNRASLYEALRRELSPTPASSAFTVAVPEFVPTKVYFMSLPAAAMMLFGRKPADAAVPPDLVGAAFVLSGRNAADRHVRSGAENAC